MKDLVRSFRIGAVASWRPSVTASLASVALGAWLFALGCAREGNTSIQEPSPIEKLATGFAPLSPLAESQTRGRKVYEHYCSICHGAEGQGDGFNSTNLAVPPRDFSSPKFWQQTTDKQLLLTVAKGGPATGKSVLMPAWGRTLSERQVRDVVAFLRMLAAQVESRQHGAVSSAKSQSTLD